MNLKQYFLIFVLVLFGIIVVKGRGSAETLPTSTPAPFICNSDIYISQGNSSSSTLFNVDTTTNPFGLNSIYGPEAFQYNAIGFNIIDGQIYGLVRSNADGFAKKDFMSIDADGVITNYGSSAENVDSYAGDVDGNGIFTFISGGKIYAYDTQHPTFPTIETGYPKPLSPNVGLADIAFSPENGLLYGVRNGQLIEINPETGATSSINMTAPYGSSFDMPKQAGGVWFDARGDFYAYWNNGFIYRVDTETAEAELLSTASRVSTNDGTACAFGIILEKSVSKSLIMAGETVTYTFVAVNGLPDNNLPFDFSDVLPEGFTFVPDTLSVSGDLAQTGTPNIYSDSSYLFISGMELLPKGTMTITVDAKSNDSIAPGRYDNQAEMLDLFPSLGGTKLSDWPNSSAQDDPTPVEVYATSLACETDSSTSAFEDLKNAGWSDWDYNDAIIDIDITTCTDVNDKPVAIDATYDIIARGAGFDHEFRHAFPYINGGVYDLNIFDADGNEVRSIQNQGFADASFVIFDSTKTALPASAGLPHPFTNTLIEQTTYTEGFTAQLSITLNDPASNLASNLPPAPYDPHIYVHDTGQEVHRVIPGYYDNTQQVNAVYDPSTPLVGFDLPLAQTFADGFKWPIEYIGLWRAYPQFVEFIQTDGEGGTEWSDFGNADTDWLWSYGNGGQGAVTTQGLLDSILNNRDPFQQEGSYVGRPLVKDLNGDGSPLIILSNHTLDRVEAWDTDGNVVWMVGANHRVKGAVVSVDLDSDGDDEVIVGSGDGQLYAWHHDGSAVAGFPTRLSDSRLITEPTIANIDADADPEILMPSTDGRLYAIEHNGVIKWSASIGEDVEQFFSQIKNASPVVTDLDLDGELEILVGSYDRHLYAFDVNGTELWRYETADAVISAPIVADFDSETAGLEIALSAVQDDLVQFPQSTLTMLNSNGARLWSAFAGWDVLEASPTAIDLDGDESLEILLPSTNGTVYAYHNDGSAVSNWNVSVDNAISSAVIIADVNDDGELDIVASTEGGDVAVWDMTGQTVSTTISPDTNASILHTPVIYNGSVYLADSGGDWHQFETVQMRPRIFIPLAVSE